MSGDSTPGGPAPQKCLVIAVGLGCKIPVQGTVGGSTGLPVDTAHRCLELIPGGAVWQMVVVNYKYLLPSLTLSAGKEWAAIKVLTQTGLVLEYSRKAQPMALATKNSEEPRLFRIIRASRSVLVACLYFNWNRIALRIRQISSLWAQSRAVCWTAVGKPRPISPTSRTAIISTVSH